MQKCNDSGYSLVEVLLGLMIFSIGALASGMMIVTSLNQNQVGKEKSAVSALVTQRLEELRSRPWVDAAGGLSLQAGGVIHSDSSLNNFSSGSLVDGFSDAIDYSGAAAADLSSMATFYLCMWRIENMTDSGLDFKRITIKGVSMHWHSSQGRWQPKASFEHVAMVFRELKSE